MFQSHKEKDIEMRERERERERGRERGRKTEREIDGQTETEGRAREDGQKVRKQKIFYGLYSYLFSRKLINENFLMLSITVITPTLKSRQWALFMSYFVLSLAKFKHLFLLKYR